MNGKKVFVIVSLTVMIITGIFVFESPSIHSKPTQKPVAAAPNEGSYSPRVTLTENPHLLKLLSGYEIDIRYLMRNANTPGAAVAIVSDTAIIYLRGFGVKAVGTKDSVDEQTVFRLGSVSKCFAPMLTGMLVEDHTLSWSDRVVKYLPDFSLRSKEQTDQLLIRHVLSQTVGLPYHAYTNLIEEGQSLPIMLKKLGDINMIGSVGKVYSYQNVAYSLISEVVRSASGTTYEKLIRERVFKPLHMNHASISYSDIMHNDNTAKPHLHTRKGLVVVPISNTYYNVAPAGGVNASAADMAMWISILLGNRKDLIDDKTLNEIFKPVIRAPSKNKNFRKLISQTGSYYALGWRILTTGTDTLCYHGGYVNGYRAELAINRKDKIGICVLTNATGQLADLAVPYFFNRYFETRDSIQQWNIQQKANVGFHNTMAQ